MISKKLTQYYKSTCYWYHGLREITSCYKAKKLTGIEYTEVEKLKLREAYAHLEAAKKLFTEIYSARIGEAITYEIRIEV